MCMGVWDCQGEGVGIDHPRPQLHLAKLAQVNGK